MAQAVRIVRKPSGKIPALIFVPLILLIASAVVPRLFLQPQRRLGQIDWKAMNGYELSVARKYPHLRRGYELALSRDLRQLAYLDRRIADTKDPEIRKGLENQRVVVTSGIDAVQQILAHFPAKTQGSKDVM